jgi:hypothetical protein
MPRARTFCMAALLFAACGGGAAPTSSPAPITNPPAATEAPAPTPSPIATNAAGVRTCVSSSEGPERPCPLTAGTWATEFQVPALTYTVPSDGWSSLNREVSPGNFHLFPPGSSMAGFNTGSGDVITVISSAVPPGTCTGAPSTKYPGTFDGLVSFLTADPSIKVSGVKDASVSGLKGKVVEIVFVKSDGCVDGVYADLYIGVDRSHGTFGIPPVTASMMLYLLRVPGNDKAMTIEIDDGKDGGSDYGDGEDWYKVAQQVVDSLVIEP